MKIIKALRMPFVRAAEEKYELNFYRIYSKEFRCINFSSPSAFPPPRERILHSLIHSFPSRLPLQLFF